MVHRQEDVACAASRNVNLEARPLFCRLHSRGSRAQPSINGEECGQHQQAHRKAHQGALVYMRCAMRRVNILPQAKGLQKLRWFCQVCEKQCRDENGFKCHIASESHQRAMINFSHNAGQLLSQFSREFEGAFLDIAKRRARSQFIAANAVRPFPLMLALRRLTCSDACRYTTNSFQIDSTRT